MSAFAGIGTCITYSRYRRDGQKKEKGKNGFLKARLGQWKLDYDQEKRRRVKVEPGGLERKSRRRERETGKKGGERQLGGKQTVEYGSTGRERCYVTWGGVH